MGGKIEKTDTGDIKGKRREITAKNYVGVSTEGRKYHYPREKEGQEHLTVFLHAKRRVEDQRGQGPNEDVQGDGA